MSFRAASFRPVEWCGGRAASSFLPALVHARFSVSTPRSRPALRSLGAAHPASVGATAGAGRSDSTAPTSQEGRADPRVEPRCSGLGTRSRFAGAGSEWAASVCVSESKAEASKDAIPRLPTEMMSVQRENKEEWWPLHEGIMRIQ